MGRLDSKSKISRDRFGRHYFQVGLSLVRRVGRTKQGQIMQQGRTVKPQRQGHGTMRVLGIGKSLG